MFDETIYDPVLQNVESLHDVLHVTVRADGILNMYNIIIENQELFYNELVYCISQAQYTDDINAFFKSEYTIRYENACVDIWTLYVLHKHFDVPMDYFDLYMLTSFRGVQVVGNVRSEKHYELREKLCELFETLSDRLKQSPESFRGYCNEELIKEIKSRDIQWFNDDPIDIYSNHRDLLLSMLINKSTPTPVKVSSDTCNTSAVGPLISDIVLEDLLLLDYKALSRKAKEEGWRDREYYDGKPRGKASIDLLRKFLLDPTRKKPKYRRPKGFDPVNYNKKQLNTLVRDLGWFDTILWEGISRSRASRLQLEKYLEELESDTSDEDSSDDSSDDSSSAENSFADSSFADLGSAMSACNYQPVRKLLSERGYATSRAGKGEDKQFLYTIYAEYLKSNPTSDPVFEIPSDLNLHSPNETGTQMCLRKRHTLLMNGIEDDVLLNYTDYSPVTCDAVNALYGTTMLNISSSPVTKDNARAIERYITVILPTFIARSNDEIRAYTYTALLSEMRTKCNQLSGTGEFVRIPFSVLYTNIRKIAIELNVDVKTRLVSSTNIGEMMQWVRQFIESQYIEPTPKKRTLSVRKSSYSRVIAPCPPALSNTIEEDLRSQIHHLTVTIAERDKEISILRSSKAMTSDEAKRMLAQKIAEVDLLKDSLDDRNGEIDRLRAHNRELLAGNAPVANLHATIARLEQELANRHQRLDTSRIAQLEDTISRLERELAHRPVSSELVSINPTPANLETLAEDFVRQLAQKDAEIAHLKQNRGAFSRETGSPGIEDRILELESTLALRDLTILNLRQESTESPNRNAEILELQNTITRQTTTIAGLRKDIENLTSNNAPTNPIIPLNEQNRIITNIINTFGLEQDEPSITAFLASTKSFIDNINNEITLNNRNATHIMQNLFYLIKLSWGPYRQGVQYFNEEVIRKTVPVLNDIYTKYGSFEAALEASQVDVVEIQTRCNEIMAKLQQRPDITLDAYNALLAEIQSLRSPSGEQISVSRDEWNIARELAAKYQSGQLIDAANYNETCRQYGERERQVLTLAQQEIDSLNGRLQAAETNLIVNVIDGKLYIGGLVLGEAMYDYDESKSEDENDAMLLAQAYANFLLLNACKQQLEECRTQYNLRICELNNLFANKTLLDRYLAQFERVFKNQANVTDAQLLAEYILLHFTKGQLSTDEYDAIVQTWKRITNKNDPNINGTWLRDRCVDNIQMLDPNLVRPNMEQIIRNGKPDSQDEYRLISQVLGMNIHILDLSAPGIGYSFLYNDVFYQLNPETFDTYGQAICIVRTMDGIFTMIPPATTAYRAYAAGRRSVEDKECEQRINKIIDEGRAKINQLEQDCEGMERDLQGALCTKYMEQYFRREKVPKDGSCFYHAIARSMQDIGINTDAKTLREKCVEMVNTYRYDEWFGTFLETQVGELGDSTSTDAKVEQLLVKIKDPNGWGNAAIEGVLIARAYGVHIHTVVPVVDKNGVERTKHLLTNGSLTIPPLDELPLDRTVHIAYYNRNHYDALIPIGNIPSFEDYLKKPMSESRTNAPEDSSTGAPLTSAPLTSDPLTGNPQYNPETQIVLNTTDWNTVSTFIQCMANGNYEQCNLPINDGTAVLANMHAAWYRATNNKNAQLNLERFKEGVEDLVDLKFDKFTQLLISMPVDDPSKQSMQTILEKAKRLEVCYMYSRIVSSRSDSDDDRKKCIDLADSLISSDKLIQDIIYSLEHIDVILQGYILFTYFTRLDDPKKLVDEIIAFKEAYASKEGLDVVNSNFFSNIKNYCQTLYDDRQVEACKNTLQYFATLGVVSVEDFQRFVDSYKELTGKLDTVCNNREYNTIVEYLVKIIKTVNRNFIYNSTAPLDEIQKLLSEIVKYGIDIDTDKYMLEKVLRKLQDAPQTNFDKRLKDLYKIISDDEDNYTSIETILNSVKNVLYGKDSAGFKMFVSGNFNTLCDRLQRNVNETVDDIYRGKNANISTIEQAVQILEMANRISTGLAFNRDGLTVKPFMYSEFANGILMFRDYSGASAGGVNGASIDVFSKVKTDLDNCKASIARYETICTPGDIDTTKSDLAKCKEKVAKYETLLKYEDIDSISSGGDLKKRLEERNTYDSFFRYAESVNAMGERVEMPNALGGISPVELLKRYNGMKTIDTILQNVDGTDAAVQKVRELQTSCNQKGVECGTLQQQLKSATEENQQFAPIKTLPYDSATIVNMCNYASHIRKQLMFNEPWTDYTKDDIAVNFYNELKNIIPNSTDFKNVVQSINTSVDITSAIRRINDKVTNNVDKIDYLLTNLSDSATQITTTSAVIDAAIKSLMTGTPVTNATDTLLIHINNTINAFTANETNRSYPKVANDIIQLRDTVEGLRLAQDESLQYETSIDVLFKEITNKLYNIAQPNTAEFSISSNGKIDENVIRNRYETIYVDYNNHKRFYNETLIELEACKAQLEQLAKTYDERKESEAELLDDRLQEQQLKLKKTSNELDSIKRLNEALQKDKLDLESQTSSLQSQKSSLQQRTLELESEKSSLQNQKVTLEEQIQQLESNGRVEELEECRNKLSTCTAALAAAEAALVSGNRELDECAVKIGAGNSKIAECEAKLAEGNEKLGAATAKLAEGNAKIVEYEAKLAECKLANAKVGDAKRTDVELYAQIASLKEQLRSKSSGYSDVAIKELSVVLLAMYKMLHYFMDNYPAWSMKYAFLISRGTMDLNLSDKMVSYIKVLDFTPTQYIKIRDVLLSSEKIILEHVGDLSSLIMLSACIRKYRQRRMFASTCQGVSKDVMDRFDIYSQSKFLVPRLNNYKDLGMNIDPKGWFSLNNRSFKDLLTNEPRNLPRLPFVVGKHFALDYMTNEKIVQSMKLENIKPYVLYDSYHTIANNAIVKNDVLVPEQNMNIPRLSTLKRDDPEIASLPPYTDFSWGDLIDAAADKTKFVTKYTSFNNVLRQQMEPMSEYFKMYNGIKNAPFGKPIHEIWYYNTLGSQGLSNITMEKDLPQHIVCKYFSSFKASGKDYEKLPFYFDYDDIKSEIPTRYHSKLPNSYRWYKIRKPDDIDSTLISKVPRDPTDIIFASYTQKAQDEIVDKFIDYDFSKLPEIAWHDLTTFNFNTLFKCKNIDWNILLPKIGYDNLGVTFKWSNLLATDFDFTRHVFSNRLLKHFIDIKLDLPVKFIETLHEDYKSRIRQYLYNDPNMKRVISTDISMLQDDYIDYYKILPYEYEEIILQNADPARWKSLTRFWKNVPPYFNFTLFYTYTEMDPRTIAGFDASKLPSDFPDINNRDASIYNATSFEKLPENATNYNFFIYKAFRQGVLVTPDIFNAIPYLKYDIVFILRKVEARGIYDKLCPFLDPYLSPFTDDDNSDISKSRPDNVDMYNRNITMYNGAIECIKQDTAKTLVNGTYVIDDSVRYRAAALCFNIRLGVNSVYSSKCDLIMALVLAAPTFNNIAYGSLTHIFPSKGKPKSPEAMDTAGTQTSVKRPASKPPSKQTTKKAAVETTAISPVGTIAPTENIPVFTLPATGNLLSSLPQGNFPSLASHGTQSRADIVMSNGAEAGTSMASQYIIMDPFESRESPVAKSREASSPVGTSRETAPREASSPVGTSHGVPSRETAPREASSPVGTSHELSTPPVAKSPFEMGPVFPEFTRHPFAEKLDSRSKHFTYFKPDNVTSSFAGLKNVGRIDIARETVSDDPVTKVDSGAFNLKSMLDIITAHPDANMGNVDKSYSTTTQLRSLANQKIRTRDRAGAAFVVESKFKNVAFVFQALVNTDEFKSHNMLREKTINIDKFFDSKKLERSSIFDTFLAVMASLKIKTLVLDSIDEIDKRNTLPNIIAVHSTSSVDVVQTKHTLFSEYHLKSILFRQDKEVSCISKYDKSFIDITGGVRKLQLNIPKTIVPELIVYEVFNGA